MEYHTKHTQVFIPLSGKPFYMVLASEHSVGQMVIVTKARSRNLISTV
jgi:ureidoglycolate hydrolase